MNLFRTVLERLSRGRIILRTIRVGGDKIRIHVTPDSQLKYLKPGRNALDRDLIEIAERFLRPDSVVWDAGANVGIFSFAAAMLAPDGVVVAIEPDAWLVSILRKTAGMEKCRECTIHVLPVAVADTDSTATLLIAARGRASNALESVGGRSQMGGVRERQQIRTTRLDTLLESMPAPDFIKMDIEGAELLALRGAQKIITEIRPVFYIEVGSDVSADVMNLFAANDYLAVSPESEVLVDACTSNAFFIPKENEQALQAAGVNQVCVNMKPAEQT
jgi:FkbM family methyltransferase